MLLLKTSKYESAASTEVVVREVMLRLLPTLEFLEAYPFGAGGMYLAIGAK